MEQPSPSAALAQLSPAPNAGAGSCSSRRRGLLVLRGLAYVAAAAALWQLLRTVDLDGVGTLLRSTGPAAALVLVPFGLQLALEAQSFRLLLARLGHRVSRRAALRVTAGAEAARLALPGGAAAGDALRPVLFRRWAGVPVGDGAAVVAVRKLCHLASQGAALGLGAALGAGVYAAALPGAGGRTLAAIAGCAAAALALAAGALGLALFHGEVAGRAERALTRLTGGRLAAVLEHRRASWAAIDGRLRALLGGHPGLLAWNGATALAGWLLDAGETWLVLRLLGARIGPGEALALEASVAVLRAGAFAVPGGIGVADLGYHALVRGLAGEPVAAAFVVVKRARDVFWIAAGFLSRPL